MYMLIDRQKGSIEIQISFDRIWFNVFISVRKRIEET
jgi:hypothetical protein